MSLDTPKDRDLEELLAEVGALRQHYRVASQEEPPVTLDEAIRAAARREVRSRPLTIGSAFGGLWRVPASIAAVVVVSATVAVMVSQHDARLPATSEQPPSGLPAEVGALKDQAEPPAPSSRTAKEQRSVDAAKVATLQGRAPAAVPAPSSPVPAEAHIEKPELAAKIESHIARTTAERDELPHAQTPAKTGLPAGAEASAPATAANATAAPLPAPEAAAKATADGPVSGQALNKKRAPANFAEVESKISPWEKDPQSWLAHIEELRAAGRMQDAEVSFRAFRSRYPDYQLPAGFVVPIAPAPN